MHKASTLHPSHHLFLPHITSPTLSASFLLLPPLALALFLPSHILVASLSSQNPLGTLSDLLWASPHSSHHLFHPLSGPPFSTPSPLLRYFKVVCILIDWHVHSVFIIQLFLILILILILILPLMDALQIKRQILNWFGLFLCLQIYLFILLP
jgi:hypothetical protein